MAAKAILVLDSIIAAVYVAAADSLEKDMVAEYSPLCPATISLGTASYARSLVDGYIYIYRVCVCVWSIRLI